MKRMEGSAIRSCKTRPARPATRSLASPAPVTHKRQTLEYVLHLSKDKRFKKLIGQQEPFSLKRRKDVHHYLIASIMSQQLSAKVADTIHKRFLNLYEGRTPLPEEILSTPLET